MTRPLLNRRLEGLGNSIFGEMSARAVATASINLGQGFPDVDGPRQIAQAAADAVLAGQGNQYPPATGIPELRHAVARHQQRFYGLDCDPETEVLAVTLGWERRLTRAGGEPLLDLALFRDRAFSAGLGLNFVAIFFFGSFMFVLTLLLQTGLGLSPLHAGIVNLPLALTFIAMTLLGPRVAARLGPRSITLGAGFAMLGTVALALIAMHDGGHLTGWGTAPATALIGIGQGLMVPSLMGAVLTHVRPQQAGAAAGVLTTTQQFAIASGVAILGAVFYEVIGGAPPRASFVSGLVVIAWIDAALLIIAALLTFLLPGRVRR